MAKLIFLLDGNVIKEYAIDKERMTIGRRASNDIHIDNLAISGEHAVIVTADNETYLEDLNSTNGTLVNTKQVKKHTLKHGDAIGLGKYQLKYVKDANFIQQPTNGFADTVLVKPKSAASTEEAKSNDAQDTEQSQLLPEVTSNQTDATQAEKLEGNSQQSAEEVEAASNEATPNASEGPRLKLLNGDNAGSALLLNKAMVKVGKPGEQVAVVTKRQDGYFITHVAGNKHPIINGKPIGAQAYALNNHDEIEVLAIKMEFCLD